MTRLLFLALIAMLATPLAAAEPIEIGLTSRDQLIEGFRLDAPSGKTTKTVLIIGGMHGDDESVEQARKTLRDFEQGKRGPRDFNLVVIPLANPDGVAMKFPPTGVAYRENAEAHYLWRWIELHTPDKVTILGRDETGLVAAIPAEAHREMDARRSRSPRELADELARFHGHDFAQPLYIQAIALIAQIRLGHLDEVQRIVEPYVDGTKNSLERPSSLVFAGHTVFTELARRTKDPRYVQMVKKIGDLGFEADERMKESMPYHDGYSDSVYMGTVIAAQAGALTGDRKYFDLAARHVAFMQKLVLRDDGLYRHSPATTAAWGRGNGFPAIGLAMTLAEFPTDHPEYSRLLKSYQAHMATLARYPTKDGLWRNVVDYPGSFQEVSATAMIGYSMLQGVKRGWLPAKEYQPIIDKAWRAVLERVAPEGRMIDACESTFKLTSVEEYLHRAALSGPEPRAGAMALMFATAMAGLD
jgi:rhamnogalacturonyl hydrolase YesR